VLTIAGSPFNALYGTVSERARLVHAFVGFERVITFRAQDPNDEDSVEIVFLADPGLPNGVHLPPHLAPDDECLPPPPLLHLLMISILLPIRIFARARLAQEGGGGRENLINQGS